jgi:nicotinamide mononucleotide transporter
VTGLEIAANAVTAASILLAARNSIHTWWTGIIGCALFGVLFYGHQLYADVTLQVFFVVTSAIGWWQWLRGNRGGALPVSRTTRGAILVRAMSGLVVAAGYGAVLKAGTDAYAPYPDSAVLVFSVIAQLLLMQRRVESWAFWLVVNSIAVPLFTSRGLYLTALLYVAYWINAAFALRHWRALSRRP